MSARRFLHDNRAVITWMLILVLSGVAAASPADVATNLAGEAAGAPLRTNDSITVTATRVQTRLSNTPSSVVILDKKSIANSAATTIDDTLRQVSGFTLFRRTG